MIEGRFVYLETRLQRWERFFSSCGCFCFLAFKFLSYLHLWSRYPGDLWSYSWTVRNSPSRLDSRRLGHLCNSSVSSSCPWLWSRWIAPFCWSRTANRRLEQNRVRHTAVTESSTHYITASIRGRSLSSGWVLALFLLALLPMSAQTGIVPSA